MYVLVCALAITWLGTSLEAVDPTHSRYAELDPVLSALTANRPTVPQQGRTNKIRPVIWMHGIFNKPWEHDFAAKYLSEVYCALFICLLLLLLLLLCYYYILFIIPCSMQESMQ